MDSLPLLRRELPVSQVIDSFSISALRAATVVSWVLLLLPLQHATAGPPT